MIVDMVVACADFRGSIISDEELESTKAIATNRFVFNFAGAGKQMSQVSILCLRSRFFSLQGLILLDNNNNDIMVYTDIDI